jgi:hypothetical protein
MRAKLQIGPLSDGKPHNTFPESGPVVPPFAVANLGPEV